MARASLRYVKSGYLDMYDRGMVDDEGVVYNTNLPDYCSPTHPSADQNLLFADLSDGYRMILTMVFDIVKQMITLNPHLGTETLEKTDGIVLIDKLDLSLHPNWQRIVAESLRRTFPLVQFIVTTHSPFVVQSLQAGEVIDLEACGGEVLASHWTQLKETAKVQADDADQSLQLVEDAAFGHAWPADRPNAQ